jgi:hypothetical protein
MRLARMTKIFINYRRLESAGHAGRIHDRLKREFGDDLLFMDVTAIPLGVNFAKYVTAEVAKCNLLLALIGPNWLDVQDNEGNYRLDDPNDLVRLEIAAALARDIPVIPIVLDGARIPKSDELPEDIRELSMRNGLDVRHASFDGDMDKLITQLKGSLGIGDASKGTRQRISLHEAAMRAHEQLRHHDVSIFGEAIAKSEIDLLSWYSDRMITPQNGKPALVTLYGRQPPSRIIEPIDVAYLSRYVFAEVDGGKETIILQERYGDKRFIDLCLDENEVAAAIAEMKAWPS